MSTHVKSRSAPAPRRRELARAVMIALAMAGALGAATAHAAAVYPLSGLDGANGFRLDGVAADDRSGVSVAAAGDVNGDGIDDVIVGAYFANSNGDDAGASYVVFGRSGGFASAIGLSTLNGTTGFRLAGVAAGDRSGNSVAAAGDVNGDGLADVIVGAFRADPNGSLSGASYVVFGRTGGFASSINLSSLNGTTGFRLAGVAAGDFSGVSVAAAGDVNGDGLADVIVGASGAALDAGASYVVFGRSGGFASSINLSSLNGTTGFRLNGEAAGDNSGCSVAAAGDVNGDGLDDIIIGASDVDPGGREYAGASYVVFGRTGGFASAFNLPSLSPTTGFRIDGAAAYNLSGSSVAGAGDFNGDGMADVIVGAPGYGYGFGAGASHVVFGRSGGFGARVDLASLAANRGFRLDGFDGFGGSGESVAAAGDVNGDGLDDIIVGASNAYQGGTSRLGKSYVAFGGSINFFSAINVSRLDGATGFRLDGVAADDFSGSSVAAAGDVNDDGIADVIIGATGADPNGIRSGASYVVFGNAAPLVTNGGPALLAAVLEDTTSPSGTRLDTAALPFYLDVDPFAGAGFTVPPLSAGEGAWQYSLDGVIWQNVSAFLSTNNAMVLLAAMQLRFVPAADFFGDSPSLPARLWDGADAYPAGAFRNIGPSIGSRGGFANDANLLALVAPITPVNDAPDFTASDPAPVRNDAGLVQIPNWVSAFDPGPGEGAQVIQGFVVSNVTDPTVFSTQPQVLADGTLQFQPAADAAGTSQFTVTAQDTGGTANGGIDTSAPQTFTISVQATADPLFANSFEGS